MAKHGDLELRLSSEVGLAGSILILSSGHPLQNHWFVKFSNLKLGTHILFAEIYGRDSDVRLCSAEKVMYDLVPNEGMLNTLRPDAFAFAIDYAKDILLAPLPSPESLPSVIRVALVTSLSQDGQNHLMLQQLAGLLRRNALTNSVKFRVLVLYSSAMSEPRPLRPALERFEKAGLVDVRTYSIG
eukprot:g1160.t1